MNERIGCWGWLGILLAIGLVYNYWYIVIPLVIVVYCLYRWRKKRDSKAGSAAADSVSNPTESLPADVSAADDTPTVKDLFDEVKTTSTETLRLDEENKFYDYQDDQLNLNVLLAAYHDNPGQARQDIQGIVDAFCKLSRTVYEKTGDLDYSFRQYIGQPDFNLLLVQTKNGQVEYFLLDDPQFLRLANGEPARPLPAATPMDEELATQLRQLKALFDEGVITQAEFEAKKRQLLGL
ncbi:MULTISPECIES: SHOCT domain-containing protein [Lactobacillaceae]|uniref:SHOCT domain-containing protein n=1 Tax=Lactobacillaceae TaxID=33958 RepID=UPI0014568896|nr:SHOCT domain-containing protein [Lactobacillus sp. HBUAS51381]NLR08609.1 SHOCT domain-containing protein [Lactobacillus sp. HBUAS51381]